MPPTTSPDIGLEALLDPDGGIRKQEGGCCIKIDGWQVPPSPHAPRGIRYSPSLHDRCGTRLLGCDNAHGVKPPKTFTFAGRRLACDHRHRTANDKGVPYAFESASRLAQDFLAEVDRVIEEAQR